MSYALVGSVGAVSTGGVGGSVSPAWGTGESRTAGNFLLLWVSATVDATLPAAPSGWSTALQKAGTSCSASLFYAIAAGGDSAPTVAGVGSAILSARLAEFSGNASSPLDQSGSAAGTTSTQVATAGGADAASGELVAYVAAEYYSASATKTNSVALNNGASATDTNNNSTNTGQHYNLGYGITTGNSGADTATLTFTTTSITGTALVVVSFKLPSAVTAPAIPMLRCSQAVARSSVI